MASNQNPRKKTSLATQARHKKRLFLPMDTADSDKLALRFHMALSLAAQGRAEASDARCLAEAVMMAALISDIEMSQIDDADLAVSEDCLRRRLVRVEFPGWRLCENEERSLRSVINDYDRQLHQTRLQNLVKATERFERLLESVDSLEKIFDARRSENLRRPKQG